MYACTDELAPFTCAMNVCLNEDFPCRWVPGCTSEDSALPLGMKVNSYVCLRNCADHDKVLNAISKQESENCSAAVTALGCRGLVAGKFPVEHFCPNLCKSQECPQRCARETPTADGERCWQRVQDRELTCRTAIREGKDCHCTCGRYYSRKKTVGPFNSADGYGESSMMLHRTVEADQEFDMEVTGVDMSLDETHAGPRVKIVEKGAPCDVGRLLDGALGLECEPGGGTALVKCKTRPALQTVYLHRWPGMRVRRCGEFDVCHCNLNCHVQGWRRIGILTVVAPPGSLLGPSPSGRVAPPQGIGDEVTLPGCAPERAPAKPLNDPSAGATPETAEVEAPWKLFARVLVYGGLEPKDPILLSVKLALWSYVRTFSELLQKSVPDREHVIVRLVTGRQLLAVRGLRPFRAVDAPSAFFLASPGHAHVGDVAAAIRRSSEVFVGTVGGAAPAPREPWACRGAWWPGLWKRGPRAVGPRRRAYGGVLGARVKGAPTTAAAAAVAGSAAPTAPPTLAAEAKIRPSRAASSSAQQTLQQPPGDDTRRLEV